MDPFGTTIAPPSRFASPSPEVKGTVNGGPAVGRNHCKALQRSGHDPLVGVTLDRTFPSRHKRPPRRGRFCSRDARRSGAESGLAPARPPRHSRETPERTRKIGWRCPLAVTHRVPDIKDQPWNHPPSLASRPSEPRRAISRRGGRISCRTSSLLERPNPERRRFTITWLNIRLSG